MTKESGSDMWRICCDGEGDVPHCILRLRLALYHIPAMRLEFENLGN